MRSALICVFLALVVAKDGSCAENDEDFKPTPIPLIDWPRDKQDMAGTLQEIIKTEAPPTVAAVPAHYWEDALRHSVYLTLVRDKIDQLIAKGDYISPDSRPDMQMAKEIDDHDLWDKIKTAKFDRLKEEPIPPGDVTILARGKLFEDNDGYRFVEEDGAQNNCSTSDCTKGVKAYWSVKRMKQGEASPGKYHYELTFSVTSQTIRKVKKPYENPVRTFTIKENLPTEPPQVRNHDKTIHHGERPQRAIWVHRNINPVQSYQKRPHYSRGLDRLFSSLFSDEDSYEEPIGAYRHKPKTYIPHVYPQHAKVGYVEDREPYHQKKLVPYPLTKPQPYRYTHAPIPPPPVSYVQHPYLNVDSLGNVPYVQPYTDNRFVPSNVVKTTRPAVLPTPITNYPLMKESTIEVPVKTKPNATEYTTKEPEVATNYKAYNHQKQSPMKISYLTDHIRPPVYNAPPGVFVTMDKKPFKPMPPLKFNHGNKPHKGTFPDFRPSPQVLDTQFSEQDMAADTAFRPISMNFTNISGESGHDTGNKKSNNKNTRKPSTSKKPTKKHENIKYNRQTTVMPDIITAQTLVEEDSSMEWANVLGAFTKTTPMASHKDRSSTESSDAISSTTPLPTPITDEITEDVEEVYEEETPSSSTTTSTSTTTTTTTAKPKKRTRPPPKFNKQDKIKKHKRSTTTTTTTTTVKPTRKYQSKKQTDDLTPQASSAATSGANSIWETKPHKAPATSTTTSTTARPTTTVKLTTTSTSSTTSTSNTIVDTEQPVVTTQPKSKNRFRQSTLMQKGTSVNHDKWSTSTLDKNRTNTVLSTKYPLRRKASKFQGYIPASTPRSPEVERDREDHKDHAFNFNQENLSSSTTEQIQHAEEDILVKTPKPTEPTDEEQEMNNEQPSEWPLDESEDEEGETEAAQRDTAIDAQESKDDNEYIFPTASVIHEVKSSSQSADLEDESTTTELTVVASPHSILKNKTKCKKKKHNNLTTTDGAYKSSSDVESTVTTETSSTTTTTSSPTSMTKEILNELFGGFTMDDATEKPVQSTSPPEQNLSQSQKYERFAHLDDDVKNFLHSLEHKNSNHTEDDKSGEEYDDDNEDDEDSPFNNDEENFDSRNFSEDYYEEAQESQDRPFSLLELMAME